MKSNVFKIIGVVVVFVLLSSCGNNSGKEELISTDIVSNSNDADGKKRGKIAEMTFESTEHDFGEIMQGEVVSYTFKFKNTGSSDLLISSHSASCGCTVPSYPKKAIKAGEEGKVIVEFNSSGKRGIQNKSVTLATNCEPSAVVLLIKAKVKEI